MALHRQLHPGKDAAAWHAKQAESLLEQAGSLPEGLMLAFVVRAAAHAALATYLELRSRPAERGQA